MDSGVRMRVANAGALPDGFSPKRGFIWLHTQSPMRKALVEEVLVKVDHALLAGVPL